jgi:hypothetical protein
MYKERKLKKDLYLLIPKKEVFLRDFMEANDDVENRKSQKQRSPEGGDPKGPDDILKEWGGAIF